WQGFSLNNLSVMALIVAAGLVVDDAIVGLENIQRHIERARCAMAAAGRREVGRLTVWRAALRGAGEVGFTLLAMNGALIVVFLSTLFMGGVVERLFREFSITLVAAMLISLAVSVTLTPALCAHGLPAGPRTRAPGPLARFIATALADLHAAYARSLALALRHRVITLLLLIGTVGLNVWLYV